MTSNKLKSLLSLTAAVLLAYAPVTVSTAAMAYDDDVDFVCFEDGDGVDQCVTVDELAAECPLMDPDHETELCAGLDSSTTANRGTNKVFSATQNTPLASALKERLTKTEGRAARHFRLMNQGGNGNNDNNNGSGHTKPSPADLTEAPMPTKPV